MHLSALRAVRYLAPTQVGMGRDDNDGFCGVHKNLKMKKNTKDAVLNKTHLDPLINIEPNGFPPPRPDTSIDHMPRPPPVIRRTNKQILEDFLQEEENRAPVVQRFITNIHDSYDFIHELGQGTFASVSLMRHKATGIERAVKILEQDNPAPLVTIEREYDILKELNHPNIARLVETYHWDRHHHLVMEYCRGGNLFESLERFGGFPEQAAANIMTQLMSALNFAHNKGIIHRDLKPENILLLYHHAAPHELHIKLADWGLACLDTDESELYRACGTPYYASPEVMRREAATCAADCWGAGVVGYLSMTSLLPFFGETIEEVITNTLTQEPVFDEETVHLSPAAVDMLKSLLNKDPSTRLTASDCLQSEWLNIWRFLSEDPTLLTKNFSMDALSCLDKFRKSPMYHRKAMVKEGVRIPDDKLELVRFLFKMMDTDFNGTISASEYLSGLQVLSHKAGQKFCPEIISEIFNSVDIDASGSIDYNEFVGSLLSVY